MLSFFRRHLVAKLFISYLIVIIVGVVVLATTAEMVVPSAFDRHLAAMADMMSGSPMMMNMDLFTSFRAAVTEALTLAATAALLSAIVVSLFVSRQVVAPIQAMMKASKSIAEGHYKERVQVAGDLEKGEQDELAQLALSFNQMAARLQQTEAMRRQLIGDVSHELRTPLTTIKGSMEGLIDGVLPASEETFQGIYREADRLQRLVNDLQELSRVEAGAYELSLHPVKVSTLIEATVRRLERQFEDKAVALETNIAPGLPQVLADEERIEQVLLNLVGNALQYTPSGGKVTISVHHSNGEVQIAVSDTGIGIAPEHLPRLFTRFYRVDKSRSRIGGGSGIGLTIAKHLVEAHGGRIWVYSQGAGKGSTFAFALPATR